MANLKQEELNTIFWKAIQTFNENMVQIKKNFENQELRISLLESKLIESKALSKSDLCEKLGISESTFKRRLKSGSIIRAKKGLYALIQDLPKEIMASKGGNTSSGVESLHKPENDSISFTNLDMLFGK